MKKKEAVLKNNIYILKMVHKASPGRIPLNFLRIILSVSTNFLFNVYLLRIVLNGMQNGTPFSDIVMYIVGTGSLLILYYIFNTYFYELYIPVSDMIIYKNIQKLVFAKAEQVDIACYEDPKFFDKYMKAANETNQIAQTVLASFAGWLHNVLTVFSVSLMIFIIDPVFIAFTLVPVIYTLTFGKKLNRLRFNFNMEMTEKTRKRDYIKRTFYLADYSKEMRLTGISNVLFGRFFDVIKDLKQTILKHGFKISVLDYFSFVIQQVFLFIGSIVYSTYRTVVVKNMLFGDCLIVVKNIVYTASAIRGVVNGYIALHNNSLSIQNIRSFLEYEPQIKEETDALDIPDALPEIDFQNVSFSYGDEEKQVLKNINLSIKPGEKIALVGHNGAGKTTLVKLLLRLYDPANGSINLYGKDIKEYKLSEYRNMFAAVFQNYKVFSMSILNNVLLKDDITDSEREKALFGMKSSGIYDKVMTLPKCENTVLTKEFDQDGTVFSGGENQKIAISRVFAKTCHVVIMDEPSSALDPIAEYKMYDAMMRACEEKSVVYISHRLSSAVLADKVYLLENGEIVESGTHTELIALRGKYAEMWEMQSEQYKKGVAVDA